MGREKRHIPIWTTDYPPLPRAGNASNPVTGSTLPATGEHTQAAQLDSGKVTVIVVDGDLILEFTELPPGVDRRWQVSSQAIVDKSRYFRAMLDPDKFIEGRKLAEHRKELAQQSASAQKPSLGRVDNESDSVTQNIPTLPVANPMVKLCGAVAVDVFLSVLCLDTQEERTKVAFENELRDMPIPTVELAIELAETFNSREAVTQVLDKVSYPLGKPRLALRNYNYVSGWGEDRVRQSLIIAIALKKSQHAQMYMHLLIVMGSRFWSHGLDHPSGLYLRWQFLPRGFEGQCHVNSPFEPSNADVHVEELYYRRQCIINTMDDLQNYFFRLYGALDDTHDTPDRPSTSRAATLGTTFSTSQQSSPFQCRAGLGNASQCDLFHLGQMTRFFTMRSKTVFLGSAMRDPYCNLSGKKEEEGDADHSLPGEAHSGTLSATTTSHVGPSTFPTETSTPSSPPSDFPTVIKSLRQYPDYQIDSHHNACGIRRRFLPPLLCIEKYVLDSRGLLGVDTERWRRYPEQMTWKTCAKPAQVDIHLDQVKTVHPSPMPLRGQVAQEEEARRLFTAKKRNWEAHEVRHVRH